MGLYRGKREQRHNAGYQLPALCRLTVESIAHRRRAAIDKKWRYGGKPATR